MKKLFGILATTLVILAGVPSTQASAAAINLTTPGAEYSGAPYTLGFQFSVLKNTNLTSLGVYDSNKDGLANRAEVGVWNTSGTLLTSAFVPSGTGGELDGYFRYVNVASFSLVSGVDYIIGAYLADTASSLFTGQGGAGSIDSNVVVKLDRFSSTGNFAFPTTTDSNSGGAWLGANFRTTTAASVPEPTSIALLGLGVLGFAASRRKLAKSKTA